MQDPTLILFQIIVLFFSVVIHEVAHGAMALALGDDTAKRAGRLTLNPISHLDPIGSVFFPFLIGLLSAGQFFFGWARPVPFNPYHFKNKKLGTILVASAGPFINFLNASVFGFLIRLFQPEGFIHFAFYYIVSINIVLGIFNLMPIFPLDGSKIFFPIFFKNYEELEYRLSQISFIFLFFFAFMLFRYLEPLIIFLIKLFTGI